MKLDFATDDNGDESMSKMALDPRTIKTKYRGAEDGGETRGEKRIKKGAGKIKYEPKTPW